MNEKFELSCFQIITYVGTARTHFINAIHCAKEGKYDEAAELIKQGDCMELMEHATAACKECNIPPLITPIRGGTDGAQLSFMGLPCPNLGTGGHAYHGPYEHITVEGMDIAVDVGLKIIELFYK